MKWGVGPEGGKVLSPQGRLVGGLLMKVSTGHAQGECGVSRCLLKRLRPGTGSFWLATARGYGLMTFPCLSPSFSRPYVTYFRIFQNCCLVKPFTFQLKLSDSWENMSG